MNDCLLGADRSKSQHFWVAVLPELTIYGHDVNAFTRERYPEDWPHVKDVFERGMLWGCWHSMIVKDGEIGSQDPAICVPIDRVGMQMKLDLRGHDLFERFANMDWPDLQILVGRTSNRPLMRILVANDEEGGTEGFFEAMSTGDLKEVWNSIQGDVDG